jgi:prepilin-type processing-associated H-X9-DG protein
VADSNDSFEVDWGYQAPVLQNCFAGAGYCVGGGVTGASDGSLQDGSIQEVHGGPDLCNILWCDGHVKAMRLTQLLTTNSVGQLGYFTISGP